MSRPDEHPANRAKEHLKVTRRELRDAIIDVQLQISLNDSDEGRVVLNRIAGRLAEALLFANWAHESILKVKGSKRRKPSKRATGAKGEPVAPVAAGWLRDIVAEAGNAPPEEPCEG